jgi:Right handed beta helix region
VRLDVLRRLQLPASSRGFLLRAALKYGVGVGVAAVVLTAGGVDRVQPNGHALAVNVLPTNVPCGLIATDAGDPHTATWTAVSSPYGTGSTYNLPVNATNNPDPNMASCPAIIVPADVTLKIDAGQGPVHISSHGAAIKVDGGHLLVLGASETNSVLFDAEADVSSWDGIVIDASDPTHRGNASVAYASIQNAVNSITITSGATSTPDPTNLSSQLPYGLALVNSGIGPSYFDGIDATNTPVMVKGRTELLTGRADGKFGTVNNIGSQGIKVTFDAAAPAVTANALDVESVTFGSSVPFAATGCLPLQLPCSAGFIGNDAILATFTMPNPPPVSINQSRFYRAGSFGVELNGPNGPVITDNNFDCNGTGSPKPTQTCVGAGLKYSAIYLNAATVDLENSVTNNVGHEDGLDAIVLNGTVAFGPSTSQKLNWKNATNDATTDHLLGYLLDGDLNLNSGTFVVPGGSFVKSKGTINLTGAAVSAGDSGAKVFTSLRDNVNIASCPSVFVQSCPAPLPAGEWGGINLVGSQTDAAIRNATRATINNASILYATTGVHIVNGSSLSISGVNNLSSIGPTFADGVLAEGTPLAVTGTTFGCPTGVCSGPSSGNHGILADYRNSGPPTTGLTIGGPNAATDRNTFQGSVNEAIRALGLAGQPVDIENNSIQNAGGAGTAGGAGVYLQGADKLTLKNNDVIGSGTGNLHYPAIWLDGVSHADFNGAISGNTGFADGLNAIAFHGDSKALAWQTVAAGGPLGYIVDGNLLVAGNLTLANGDYATVLAGTVTVHGTLTSTGAELTSLKAMTWPAPSCGSVFVPRASGVCPATAAGDWGGLVLDPGSTNRMTNSAIRYAATGISLGAPTGTRLAQNLAMTNSNITNTAADGVSSRSPVSISGGAFTNNGGHGIKIDLSNVTSSAFQPLLISGTTIASSGQDGVLAVGLAGQTVQIDQATIDHAGAFGINLRDAGKDAGPYPGVYTIYPGRLTLTNNTVTNTAATFPAIYLNGVFGSFANVSGNKGAFNGVDAIAFHGTVTDDLSWKTARKTGDPTTPLGYVLDSTLTMAPPPPPLPPALPPTPATQTLTVSAGDIVKVGNGGLLKLQGVYLHADDTSGSSQKIFTSLTDDSVGVGACHSVLVNACPATAQPGDWGGIALTSGTANGALVNTAVRYASTGILITSGASSTSGSSVFGLVVSGSSIGPSAVDGINAVKTAISVTTSSISGGAHGISVDFSGGVPNTPVRLSGNRFASTSAEAILGQALAGQPVWISDNRIQGAGTYGIRLLSADQLVLRNNNVAASGGGPGAGAGRYPAIYLPSASADFATNIRGNVGSGNGLDALVFDGKVNRDLSWITASNTASTHPLGYLLDGGLTLQGGNLLVGSGGVVKSLGGPITINGGKLIATGTATGVSPTSRSAIFTSLKDNPLIPASAVDASDAAAVSCPSVLVSVCNPGPGDWGGLVITSNVAGDKGRGDITYGLINYANTGISLDSGPIPANPEQAPTNFRLTVANTTISNASKDGINSLDTPFSVADSSLVQNVGANGIIASFFSPANCPSTIPTVGSCLRLNVTATTITGAGKDGIIANGLSGQPTVVSGNTVTDAGTYGIRLVGADKVTLTTNHVRKSAPPPSTALRYPAIYLGSVKADFEVSGAGTVIQGNDGKWNGLDAIVFHGEATNSLTWKTAVASAGGDVAFGYLLDGALTVDGDLATNEGDVVKIMNGGIKINGGSLQALGTTLGTTFTSLKDNPGLPACHSVFIPDPCPVLPATLATNTDWNGINIDASNSVFNKGRLLYATSGITINAASLKLKSTLITGLSGYAVTTTGTASAEIDCASIHGNGGGVSSTGAAGTSVTYSDLYGNAPGKDYSASVAATATNDWWGANAPNPNQYSAFVTVTTPLPQQAPTFKLGAGAIAFSSTNTNTSVNQAGDFGKGTLTVTATADREVDPTVPLNASFLGPNESVAHLVTGSWKPDHLTWQGTAAIDEATNATGTNMLTISGARSCVPDGSNVMAPETATFSLNFGKATVTGPGAAQNVGGKSATFTESANPNGWSNQTDAFVFFQYKLQSGTYVPNDIAGLQTVAQNPTGLLGYTTIGHGMATVPVTAQVSQLLATSTVYDYRVIAVASNGITIGPDHQFTTLGALNHFALAAVASPQTAGTAFSVQATAYDLNNNALTDYLGSAAVVTSNLSTAPAGNCAGLGTACPPKVGSQSWSAGLGTISGVTAYVAEDNRTLTLTDGLVSVTSASFKVNATSTATMLWISSPPQTFAAGTTSGPITVVLTDPYANPIAASASIVVNLTSGAGTGSFVDAVTSAPITAVTIAMNSSSATFKYTDTAAGSPKITASPPGGSTLTAASQTETVTP